MRSSHASALTHHDIATMWGSAASISNNRNPTLNHGSKGNSEPSTENETIIRELCIHKYINTYSITTHGTEYPAQAAA